MNLFVYLLFLAHSVFNISTNTYLHSEYTLVIDDPGIEVRSVLSDEMDKVYVALSLPGSAAVGFEIYNEAGKILHLWHQQELGKGKHELALGLPSLPSGRYALHILINATLYKHLVHIP